MRFSNRFHGRGTRRPARSFLASVAALAAFAVFGAAGGSVLVPLSAWAASRVTETQATATAVKAVPGEVTGVTIERKRGKNVYVVEIIAKADGVETDVLVDLDSGKVLGTEK